MNKKNALLILIAIISLALALISNFSYIYSKIYYTLYNKNQLRVSIKILNNNITSICADPENKLYLKTVVKNFKGIPMENAPIKLEVNNDMGKVYSASSHTDSQGELTFTYSPPNYYEIKNPDKTLKIISTINNTKISAFVKLQLIPVPVVFVHGYQENAEMFDNFSEFLQSKGYICSAIDFDSSKGVVKCTNELKSYLENRKGEFLKEGILAQRFTLITHSMGGLIARYHTTSDQYVAINDVNKLIFLSVPHKGSHLASLAENLFNDQTIRDLVPDNELFTTYDKMINHGLNSFIQTGNLLAQYDEVVSLESASLEDWNISTEVFQVGDNSFTMSDFLSGNLLEAPNHKSILNNTKVFERVWQMLENKLSYPSNLE